jgi:CubicO group peptidase (beta-lactamase class C family)
VRPDDRFDLASLTKLYTAALVLRRVEQGACRLDDPVRKHVPEVEAEWTLEDLLAHRTGTTADLLGEAVRHGIRPCEPGQERALWRVILGCKPIVPLERGQSHYSDVDFLLAQAASERLSAWPSATIRRTADQMLAEWMAEELFRPLGLRETGFCPSDPERCVPTEVDDRWRHRLIVGEVHDEMAATLGGVAGHAGLFATAADVGRFCEMWLGSDGREDRGRGRERGRGRLGSDPQHLTPNTQHPVALGANTLNCGTRELALAPPSSDFALGWRLCNASFFPGLERSGAVGHLGFTGTSAFLFPRSRTVFVLLSNRVYPRRDAAPSRLPLLRDITARLSE